MKTKEEILKEFDELYGYNDYDDLKKFLIKALTQTREETLKEIIREYQDNELDGKDYDFYFSIRAKIDELNKLKK